MPPSARSPAPVPSDQHAARRRRQCSRRRPGRRPPASASCRPCSPTPVHLPGPDDGQPVAAGPGAGPGRPEGAAQHWPSGGGRRRIFGCGRGRCVVAPVGWSWSGDGLVFHKPLSLKPGALSYTYNPPPHSSFRWIGGYVFDVALSVTSFLPSMLVQRTATFGGLSAARSKRSPGEVGRRDQQRISQKVANNWSANPATNRIVPAKAHFRLKDFLTRSSSTGSASSRFPY